MPIIAESCRGLKIASRCFSTLESEAAGELQSVNFPPTPVICDFAFLLISIGFSHKSDSGTGLIISTTRSETSADCGLGLKLDRGISSHRAVAGSNPLQSYRDLDRVIERFVLVS